MTHCCKGFEKERKRTHKFLVQGMTCNHCAMNIRKAVSGLPGVEEVSVSLKSGLVTVVGDAPKEAIAESIKLAGYTVD